MCWPLTRRGRPHSDDKGDREAAATWRAGGRDAEECPRKTTRVFAARGHDRRSPPVKSQGDGRMRTGTGPETISWSPLRSARHGRADSPAEARRSCSERPRPSPFRKVEEDQRVGFETVLTLTQLSASRRPTMRQLVAERSGLLNGPSETEGNLSCDGRHEIIEVRDRLSRVSEP